MFRPGTFTSAALTLVILLPVAATPAHAQHHHDISTGAPILTRPDGVDEKDSLKDFHHALAVQATSQQIAEFQEILRATAAAQDKLHAVTKSAAQPPREGTTLLDHALDEVRTRTRKFQDGFSEPQKSGLKELTKRLEKADTDLDQQTKRFDQFIQSEAASADVSAQTAGLDKSLADFSTAQLALGREMGITLATGQDVAFTIPKVTTHVNVGQRSVAVGVSSSLSQTTSEGDVRTFQLETTVDLGEFQQSVREILNAELYSSGCGERLTVKNATIVPATPATSLELRLHYERWSCMRFAGQNSMTELAESDGTVEMKLTPAPADANVVRLTPEFKRVEAAGAMADDLRSGDLGDTVREKVSAAVLAAVMAGADFKSTMPGALQNGVTLQNVKFQDPSGSGLKAVLQGQVRLSNDQVSQLASQLNQTLSAQGSPAPVSAPANPAPQTK